MTRMLTASGLALLVSFLLFWLMQFMIMQHRGFKETQDTQMVDFVRLKRDTQIQTRERKIPEKPVPQKQPPQLQMQKLDQQITPLKTPEMNIPNLDLPVYTNRFDVAVMQGVSDKPNTADATISTNLIPLVKIKPRYPMRAKRRKIEGWVRIGFIITTDGSVRDAKVLEAQPSSVFNSSALRAIKKWKFKPKIVAGKAVEQRVDQVLNFKLSK